MADVTPTPPWDWKSSLDKGGTVAVLAAILWSGSLGYWVFGTTYKEAQVQTQEARKERDDYRDLFLKAVDHVPHVIGAAGPGEGDPREELLDSLRRLDEKIDR